MKHVMKPWHYLLAGAAGLGLYLIAAKAAGDAAPTNPWRGTGSACEKAFDKLKLQDQKDLVAFRASSAKSGEARNPEVLKTINAMLGTSDCA